MHDRLIWRSFIRFISQSGQTDYSLMAVLFLPSLLAFLERVYNWLQPDIFNGIFN